MRTGLSWRAALILYVAIFATAAAVPAAWELTRGPDGGAGPAAQSLPTVSPFTVPSTPAPDCDDEDELVVATGDDISTGSVRRDVFDDWNRHQRRAGDPQAKLLELSASTDVRRAQMAALAQAGSCAYPILMLDVAWVAEFARHGYIRTIPLSRPGRFLLGPLRAAQIDGEQYGVPFAADAPLEYRRTDITTGGYLLQLVDREAGTINFLEMAEFGGGRLLDGADRTSVRLGDDTWKALAAKSRASATGASVPVLRASLELDEDAGVAVFKDAGTGDKRVSYMRNWPIVFHQLATDPRMRYPDGRLRFEVRAPARAGVLGGSVLAISAHIPPEKLDAAMRLIEHLTGETAQSRLFACGGYAPVLAAVYDAFRDGRGRPCPGRGGSEAVGVSLAELTELAKQVRTSVKSARPRPKSPYYAQFSAAFRRCARGVWKAPEPPQNFPDAEDMLRSAMRGRVLDDPPC